MALSAIPLAVMFSGCTQTHTIAECVLGAHYPPGREDVCVPNSIPSATKARLLAIAETHARGTVNRVVAVESRLSTASHYLEGATYVWNDHLIWVVEATGRLQCGACFGSSDGTATTMTWYLDFSTFAGNAVSWSRARSIDLSHLGPVHVLK